MSVQVSKKKQLVFGVIVLIIILGVIEASANVWWYELNTCAFETSEIYAHLDEETKKKMCIENYNIQFTDKQIIPTLGDTITINSDGFRGSEITKIKPENTYRIFVIGGSTTFGTGVTDDQTVPSYLQKLFDDTGIDFHIEIINAGIASTWSLTETEMIKTKIVNEY